MFCWLKVDFVFLKKGVTWSVFFKIENLRGTPDVWPKLNLHKTL